MIDFLILGGGAAGIFASLAAKEASPSSKVVVLEKSAKLLSKVKISGGGRCNVTHSCFDLKRLCTHYPRGGRELLGPFHRFGPRETVDWFAKRGVKLKTEADGRMFPTTDSSETIIKTLLSEADRLGVEIRRVQKVEKVEKNSHFLVTLKDGELEAKRLLLATGSAQGGHAFARALGHTIEPPVPSLFTFNVPSSPLKELSGVSVEEAELKIEGHLQRGPLLITHFGFSGPAALKLSAWAARPLAEKDYRSELKIDWLPHLRGEEIVSVLKQLKGASPTKKLSSESPFGLPRALWRAFSDGYPLLKDLSFKQLHQLADKLKGDVYEVEGKTTNKEEFVTCGGVRLSEVNFKTMESKKCPGLFFAGEILDIDGVTGGFNFQSAWTTGAISGGNNLTLQL